MLVAVRQEVVAVVGSRLTRWSAVGWFALVALAVIAGRIRDVLGDEAALLPSVHSAIVSLIFPLTGTLILVRRRNPVGIGLAATGLYFAAEAASEFATGTTGAGLWMRWLGQVLWAPAILPLVTFVPLLFPDGALPSRRWRPVAWLAGTAIVGLTVGNAVAPDLFEDHANPAAVPPFDALAPAIILVGGVALVASFLAAIASVIVRFRRATGATRQQLRWLRAGLVVAFLSWVTAGTLESLGQRDVGGFVFATGLLALPLTIVVAILRYRLWDIERFVSRTVSYAVVSAVSLGMYAAVVVVPSTLADLESDVLVAGATLLVAATFRPLRSRIQAVVDRRFDRRRYDAARTVTVFGSRMRDEVHGEALVADLRAVVASSLSPASVGVWLVPKAASPVGRT